MIPDRLPAELREVIAKFPPGTLQFEVGIQTFNPEVGTHISRRQNYDRLADNFNFLRSKTGVHIHADLIVGLPVKHSKVLPPDSTDWSRSARRKSRSAS